MGSIAKSVNVLCDRLHMEEYKENLLYSPLSISLAFFMLQNGCRGDTRKEITQLFKFKGDKSALKALNKSLKKLTAPAGDDDALRICIANRLFLLNGYQLNADFTSALTKHFGCSVGEVDFTSSEAIAAMNKWVTEKTNDKITQLFDSLDSDTKLVMVNAVYFKGKWKVQFNHFYNHMKPFHFLNSPAQDMEMMGMERYMTFINHDDAKGVFLPLRGDQYEFICLVPDPHITLKDFMLKHMNNDHSLIDLLKSNSVNTYGRLIMPKFRIECELNLKDVMKKLGIEKCFDGEVADLSGITNSDKLFVSQAIHKTFLAVNEEGVEAAAVTGMACIYLRGPPPPQIIVNADRPFLSIIWHKKEKIVVFLSAVTDPIKF